MQGIFVFLAVFVVALAVADEDPSKKNKGTSRSAECVECPIAEGEKQICAIDNENKLKIFRNEIEMIQGNVLQQAKGYKILRVIKCPETEEKNKSRVVREQSEKIPGEGETKDEPFSKSDGRALKGQALWTKIKAKEQEKNVELKATGEEKEEIMGGKEQEKKEGREEVGNTKMVEGGKSQHLDETKKTNVIETTKKTNQTKIEKKMEEFRAKWREILRRREERRAARRAWWEAKKKERRAKHEDKRERQKEKAEMRALDQERRHGEHERKWNQRSKSDSESASTESKGKNSDQIGLSHNLSKRNHRGVLAEFKTKMKAERKRMRERWEAIKRRYE